MRRVFFAVLLLLAVLLPGVGPCLAQRPAARGAVAPGGPTVVIDTTMGRVVCRLYARQAPLMTANFVGLATGTKDWKDGTTGQVVHGKPFYDGTAVFGWGQGFGAGDRVGGRSSGSAMRLRLPWCTGWRICRGMRITNRCGR